MDKRIAAGAVAALMIIFGFVLKHNLLGYNETQNWQVYQSIRGTITIIDDAGYYPKFFGTSWDYPRAMEAEYTSQPTQLSPGDDSIRATFNDGGTAQVSTYVRIGLPVEADRRLNLHQQFSANKANITAAVKAHLANCIKAAGPVMSASENQASRKSEFNQIIEGQLAEGLYTMRRTMVTLDDAATIEEGQDANGKKISQEKKATVWATEIVRGKDGKPIIAQDSPLKAYDISILQFSVTEIDYDQKTLEQFAAKKTSYLAAEQAKAERQQEVQQRLMVEEKGRRQVADVQAEENQKKERAMIQATQAAEVAKIAKEQAVTQAQQKVEVAEQAKREAVMQAQQKVEVAQQFKAEAETLKEIASIKMATAELDKKASISQAEAKQKQVELSGAITEKDRVLAEIKADRDVGVAKELAHVATPGVVINGGGEGGGNVTGSLLNVLLLKQMGVMDAPQAK